MKIRQITICLIHDLSKFWFIKFNDLSIFQFRQKDNFKDREMSIKYDL